MVASNFFLAAVVVARFGLPRLPKEEAGGSPAAPREPEGVVFEVEDSLWFVSVGVA